MWCIYADSTLMYYYIIPYMHYRLDIVLYRYLLYFEAPSYMIIIYCYGDVYCGAGFIIDQTGNHAAIMAFDSAPLAIRQEKANKIICKICSTIISSTRRIVIMMIRIKEKRNNTTAHILFKINCCCVCMFDAFNLYFT